MSAREWAMGGREEGGVVRTALWYCYGSQTIRDTTELFDKVEHLVKVFATIHLGESEFDRLVCGARDRYRPFCVRRGDLALGNGSVVSIVGDRRSCLRDGVGLAHRSSVHFGQHVQCLER